MLYVLTYCVITIHCPIAMDLYITYNIRPNRLNNVDKKELRNVVPEACVNGREK